jgi:hypothetical protein
MNTHSLHIKKKRGKQTSLAPFRFFSDNLLTNSKIEGGSCQGLLVSNRENCCKNNNMDYIDYLMTQRKDETMGGGGICFTHA